MTVYTDWKPLQMKLTEAFGGEGFINHETNKTMVKADFEAMSYNTFQGYADTIIAE